MVETPPIDEATANNESTSITERLRRENVFLFNDKATFDTIPPGHYRYVMGVQNDTSLENIQLDDITMLLSQEGRGTHVELLIKYEQALEPAYSSGQTKPNMLAAGIVTIKPDKSVLVRTGNSSSVIGWLQKGWEQFGIDPKWNTNPESFQAREAKLENVVSQGFTQCLKQSIPEPQVMIKNATINFQTPKIT